MDSCFQTPLTSLKGKLYDMNIYTVSWLQGTTMGSQSYTEQRLVCAQTPADFVGFSKVVERS